MQFKNNTGKFVCFPVPQLDGSPKWYNFQPNEVLEVPDSEGWRAVSSGLTKLGEEKKGSEVKDFKVIKEYELSPTKTKVKKKARKR